MSPLQFRIRELRAAKAWSQAELAERAGTRQATISGLETGQSSRVDLTVLDRIAKALGVTADALVIPAPPRKRSDR